MVRPFGHPELGTKSIVSDLPAAIDAFRAFQIPESMQVEYGYPALSPEVKEKIRGLNAARVNGINRDTARSKMGRDYVAWGRAAIEECKQLGAPHL